MAEKVVVTGGSGRAGEYIIAELAANGYDVYNADFAPPRAGSASNAAQFWRIDVTDYGEVLNALTGADAVIHMAAIPAPNMDPEHKLFRINMMANWNVLEAAEVHGIERICMASSINALGAGWGSKKHIPEYLPIDEDHPTRVEDAYSQSKWLGEQMGDAFVRRRPGKVQIANMRFHALWDKETAERHKESGDQSSVGGRAPLGFWSWVGRHDAARACRLAIEKEFGGHEAFFINATDTVLDIPTMDAIEAEYPGVEIREPITGFKSPLSVTKAEKLLDWIPVESWREGTVKDPEPNDGQPAQYQAQWTR
ncbi:MAG: NAD-dependent epimerase/dehydratase family protein [Dehalococcoidia bacterium]